MLGENECVKLGRKSDEWSGVKGEGAGVGWIKTHLLDIEILKFKNHSSLWMGKNIKEDRRLCGSFFL